MKLKENIVISGLSGRYPECNNVEEFKEALFKGVDLVTENGTGYPPGAMNTPVRLGKVPHTEKFDAAFFGIHPKQAEYMDPRHRKLLETVYECIVDAGYNPQELRGTKTGVYVGITLFTNTEALLELNTNGYANIGLSLALSANRISYCFDFKGPSYATDSACSSSSVAFVNAFNDMKAGITDSAIVCGTQILFHPFETLEFKRLNMLADDGKPKVFSTFRDGYVRSESVVSILLQKESQSRRIYATVLGAGSNSDGYKKEGVTFPSRKMQSELIRDIYREANIDLNNVAYVEAHATGTAVGDLQECESIVETFCTKRRDPLPIGSVKSNMGHSETVSGLCSVTKVLIAMETGVIPACLHTKPLDMELPGIRNGKIKVVDDNLAWNGGIVGINCFGFGGANTHIVLESNSKEKVNVYKRPKSRLVLVSGRTEEAVNHFLNEIEKNQDDDEFLALVDEVHKMNVEGHNFRGYILLGENSTREIGKYIKKRPIWFIYSGMGSQWTGMGRDLLKIPTFRRTIERCASALKPYDVDLIDILTNTSETTFDNVTNCFCAIAAVEIALTDVLYQLGIKPDGIAGHSLGEVGCAYADGQMTPEEAVLLGYARGYASTKIEIQPGQMAVIGLSKEECAKLLPNDIFIACHNSSTNITISGPKHSVRDFVEKLTFQGIFARNVNSCGIAYHSKYIKDAGPVLFHFVKNVLKTPTPRSTKWISTSIPDHRRDESWAKLNSVEYHTNNFCGPVLFDQIYQHIPSDAIVIEVAPHGLMQAILKRELRESTIYIPLTSRSSKDNEEFFLSSLGKLHIAGGVPNLRNFYTNVTFPVSRGTKMLSPMIKWDHHTNWFTPFWKNKDCFGKIVTINLSDEKYKYLEGHCLDGRVIMPGAGYVELLWQVFSHMTTKNIEDLPVVIENIKFKRATILPPNQDVKFLVNIMKQSGNFEIFEGGSVVITGRIWSPKDIAAEYINPDRPTVPKDNYLPLKQNDFYKECHLRRYMCKGLFQGMKECDIHGLQGKIEWKGSFTSFLDNMLQLHLLKSLARELFVPSSIERLVIDPVKHLRDVAQGKEMEVYRNPYLNTVTSGAIEIVGLEYSRAPQRRKIQEDPVLETYEFVPFISPDTTTFENALYTALQIILQNCNGLIKSVNICEVPRNDDSALMNSITQILENQAATDICYIEYNQNHSNEYDVIVTSHQVVDQIDKEVIAKHIKNKGFVLYVGDILKIEKFDLQIVYKSTYNVGTVCLLRSNYYFPDSYTTINIRNSDFDWLEKIKNLVKHKECETAYLFSHGDEISGLLGLTKCLLTEPIETKFRSVLILDKDEEMFSVDEEFYRHQLTKDLTINVLKNRQWGTFVHLPLKELEHRKVNNASTTIVTPGDLSSLRWIEKPCTYVKSDPKSFLVHVFYSALNFRDIMVATGRLELPRINIPTVSEVNVGLEYAGVTDDGKKVMGLVPFDSLGLQVQSHPIFTWEVPTSWSLEDAATVPCVYSTCYYAMVIRGQIRQGESILIHSGSGGVGIAAISLALGMGCTVFITVGSQEKRDFIRKLYPQLEDKNIGDSRSKMFKKMVMQNTKGYGVDLVLNSLTEDLFQESLRCVAKRGRFLEIGKMDFFNETPINSKMFLKNCSFHGVLLDDLFVGYSEHQQQIHYLLEEGIRKGIVKPLPRKSFSETEVETAFRYLSSSKHTGKVLVQIRKEDPVTIKSPLRSIRAIPKVYFNPEKSYILIGGLGGFGLEFTDWMIRKGATKLVLNSRRGISDGYQSFCLKKWSLYKGIIVKVSTYDTSNLEGANSLVMEAQDLGPLGGVFNMALDLQDALIQNQTKEMYENVFRSKIISGQNMDIVTRTVCPKLDHFVVISSLACGRGNIGQSNYGMANSALEMLCLKRKKENLPGLAIQLGIIADVGVLARGAHHNALGRVIPQNVQSCLNALENFMLQSTTIASSYLLSDKNTVPTTALVKTPAEIVAHIVGLSDIDLVDHNVTLSRLGLDSLMATEIKQTLYRSFQIELSTDEIQNLTFDNLVKIQDVKHNRFSTTTPVENGDLCETFDAIVSKQAVVKLTSAGPNERTIFLIHPVEGKVDVLRNIGEHLKALVYGLECTRDANYDDFQDCADYFIKQVKSKQPRGPYFLCGYSYGGVLAFEMALQLESNRDDVTVILIESAPAYLKNILESRFLRNSKSLQAKAKTNVLKAFSSTLTSVNQKRVNELLETSTQWEKQVQDLSSLISEETGIDADEVAVSAEMYFNRCKAVYYYEPKSIFRGKLSLIRREDNQYLLPEDYDLQKICRQKIDVLKLKGDHLSVLLGNNTQVITDKINEILK